MFKLAFLLFSLRHIDFAKICVCPLVAGTGNTKINEIHTWPWGADSLSQWSSSGLTKVSTQTQTTWSLGVAPGYLYYVKVPSGFWSTGWTENSPSSWRTNTNNCQRIKCVITKAKWNGSEVEGTLVLSGGIGKVLIEDVTRERPWKMKRNCSATMLDYEHWRSVCLVLVQTRNCTNTNQKWPTAFSARHQSCRIPVRVERGGGGSEERGEREREVGLRERMGSVYLRCLEKTAYLFAFWEFHVLY